MQIEINTDAKVIKLKGNTRLEDVLDLLTAIDQDENDYTIIPDKEIVFISTPSTSIPWVTPNPWVTQPKTPVQQPYIWCCNETISGNTTASCNK